MPSRVSGWVDDATGGASLPDLDGLQDAFMNAIQGGIDIIFKTLDFFGFTDEETAVEPDDFGFNEENTRDLAGSPGAEQIERETNAQTFTSNEYEPAGTTGEGMEDAWGNFLDYYEAFEVVGQSLIGVYLALLIIAAGIGLYGKSRLIVKFGRAVTALILIALGPSLIAQLIDLSNTIAFSFIEQAFVGSVGDSLTTAIAAIGGIALGIVFGLPLAAIMIGALLFILVLFVVTEVIIMMLFVIFPLLMVGWAFGKNSLFFSPFRKAATVFVPTIFLPAGLAFVLWAALTIPFDMVGDGSDGIALSALWAILLPIVLSGILIGGSYLVLKATWAGRMVMGSVAGGAKIAAAGGLAAAAGGTAAAKRTGIAALGGGSNAALRQANQEQLLSGATNSDSSGGMGSGSSSDSSGDRNIGEKASDKPNMGATNGPEGPRDGGLFNRMKDRAMNFDEGGLFEPEMYTPPSEIPERAKKSGSNLKSAGGSLRNKLPTSDSSDVATGQDQMEFDIDEGGEAATNFFSKTEQENGLGNRSSAVETIENSDNYSDVTPELQDTFEQAENGDPDATARLNDRQNGKRGRYYVGDLGDTRSDYLTEQEIKDFGPDSDYGTSSSAESSSTASASSEAGSSAVASSGAKGGSAPSGGSSSSSGGSGGPGPSQSSQGGGRPSVSVTEIANNDVDNGDFVNVNQEIEQVERAGENDAGVGYDGRAEVRGGEQRVAINDYQSRDPEIVDQDGNKVDDLDGKTISRIENAKVDEYDPEKGGSSELHNFDSAAKGAYDTAENSSREAFKEIRLQDDSTVVVENENN